MKRIITGATVCLLMVSFLIPFSASATSATVTSATNSNSYVSLVSPNGGEKFNAGDTFVYSAHLKTSSDADLDVYLTKNRSWKSVRSWFDRKAYHVAEQKIDGSASAQKVSGKAVVPADIKAGKYSVVITLDNSDRRILRDGSDKAINITRNRVPVPTPTPRPEPDTRTDVSLVSPNGGEGIKIGSKQEISWRKTDNVRAVDLFLYTMDGTKKFAIAYSITGNSYGWEAGRFQEVVKTNEGKLVRNGLVASGAYYMEVCEAGTRDCDRSNSYFKLYSDTVDPVPPTRNRADINYDGKVNVDDLLMVINAWGSCPVVDTTANVLTTDDSLSVSTSARIMNPCPADITGDKRVDNEDLKMVIRNWTV